MMPILTMEEIERQLLATKPCKGNILLQIGRGPSAPESQDCPWTAEPAEAEVKDGGIGPM